MLKRGFDILLSGLGLVVSLPLWGLISLAIKLQDAGPVFYRQQRVGKDGFVFTGLKFRSMVPDSDQKWGAVPAAADDPRITKVGKVLRATAMDELPQLWNILRGDMSFVGPRPEWVELVKRFRAEIPRFDLRHRVRPGLTGLAQVYGHSEMSRRNKLRYDLLYARRQSFWLDLRLVLMSFAVTFGAAGSCGRRNSRGRANGATRSCRRRRQLGVLTRRSENACAEGALECGGLTPPFDRLYVPGRLWRCQGGVKPPHSKALRAVI